MSTLCAVDNFVVLATDTVSTTYTRQFTDAATGLAFQPTVVMLFCTGRTVATSGIGRGDMQHSRGFAISTTNRAYISGVSVDAVGTAYAKKTASVTGCLGLMATTGAAATSGILDVDAVLVDGMRFILDEVFEQDIAVQLIALGGDIDTANIVDYVAADDACVTDPIDITGFGFDPVMGVAITQGGDPPWPKADTRTGFGGFRSTAEEGTWGSGVEDGVGTMTSARYSRYGDISLARVGTSGGVRFRNDFNSLITDGFRLNCLEDNDVNHYILGLLGGSYSILDFVSRTTVGTITLTPGFEVAGGIILGVHAAESVDNDSDAADGQSMSVGVFNGIRASQQFCHYCFEADAVATSEVTVGSRYGSVYMKGDEAASPALDGSIEIQEINSTQVILNQSNPDAIAGHCIAILFGARGKARQRLDPMSGVQDPPQYTRYE